MIPGPGKDETPGKESMDPVPLTVIAGYLGAGKTTLINQMLANNDGQRLALLVNDFGQINIDAKLVKSQDGDTINLSNGCVCCTLGEDFSEALKQIEGTSNQFDRVIVEMSGIGEPDKVVNWIQGSEFLLDGIVVLADTTTIREWAENRYAGPLIRRQLSAADLILLTHTDLVDEREVDEVKKWVTESTTAPVLQSPVSMPMIVGISRLSEESPNGTSTPSETLPNPLAHHASSIHAVEPIAIDRLEKWLARRPKQVIRVKGIIRNPDESSGATILQVCGRREETTPSHLTSDDGLGSIVAIATIDLDKSQLDSWLAEIGESPRNHHH